MTQASKANILFHIAFCSLHCEIGQIKACVLTAIVEIIQCPIGKKHERVSAVEGVLNDLSDLVSGLKSTNDGLVKSMKQVTMEKKGGFSLSLTGEISELYRHNVAELLCRLSMLDCAAKSLSTLKSLAVIFRNARYVFQQCELYHLFYPTAEQLQHHHQLINYGLCEQKVENRVKPNLLEDKVYTQRGMDALALVATNAVESEGIGMAVMSNQGVERGNVQIKDKTENTTGHKIGPENAENNYVTQLSEMIDIQEIGEKYFCYRSFEKAVTEQEHKQQDEINAQQLANRAFDLSRFQCNERFKTYVQAMRECVESNMSRRRKDKWDWQALDAVFKDIPPQNGSLTVPPLPTSDDDDNMFWHEADGGGYRYESDAENESEAVISEDVLTALIGDDAEIEAGDSDSEEEDEEGDSEEEKEKGDSQEESEGESSSESEEESSTESEEDSEDWKPPPKKKRRIASPKKKRTQSSRGRGGQRARGGRGGRRRGRGRGRGSATGYHRSRG